MKHIWYAALVTLALSGACRGSEEHGSADPAPTPDLNPVQHEMRLLTSALETAVRGIGAGDVRALEHELHGVHEARQATEAAIQDGRYRPPKGADRMERFAELDGTFHEDLAQLVERSHRNDVAGTAEALGVVVRSCQGCHLEFRR